jgi:hypothetical protein
MTTQLLSVNWLAVLVSSIVFMVLGFIWYTALGKQWAAYTGWTREKVQQLPRNDMMISYGLTFVSAFLQAWVLAAIFRAMQVTEIKTALAVAAVVWVGFTAAPAVGNYAFEHRPWGLFAINNALYLINLLVAGIILVLWK